MPFPRPVEGTATDIHRCRLGLLAGACIHWVAAGLMLWDHFFPSVSDAAAPEWLWLHASAIASRWLGAS